ncbi:hypothetical protein ACU639_00820 [Streptomyces cynarae]
MSSYHFVGHHRVAVSGDEASVKVKGYTYSRIGRSIGVRPGRLARQQDV